MEYFRDIYKAWNGVQGPSHGSGPWTTPNFQQEIANMKIYQRSGYEQKHRLVFIAYVLEGLSRNSGLAG